MISVQRKRGKPRMGDPQNPSFRYPLRHGDGEGGGGELGVGAGEGLGAGADALDVLAGAQALVGGEVVDEVLEVGVEGLGLGAGDEGEDGHLAVGPAVEVERDAADGGGGDLAAGRRDGAGAAEGGQPDHDLVLLVAARGRAGEEVVGDVGDDVAAGVAPLPGGGDRRDGAELLLLDVREDDVGVRLDLALAAGPRPAGVPGDGGAAQAVDAGALATAVGVALAPKVVVDGVRASLNAAPLVAEVGATVESLARGGRGNGGCASAEDSGGELHCECGEES